MNKPEILLAKTPENPKAIEVAWESLVGHSKEVFHAAMYFLGKLAPDCDPYFKSDAWQLIECLTKLGALLHDLGKATDVFQGMLLQHPKYVRLTHPVRHEILSALLLSQVKSPLQEWLQNSFQSQSQHFPWLLSWVVGGHHLKLHEDGDLSEDGGERLLRIKGVPNEMHFWGAHGNIQELLNTAWALGNKTGSAPKLFDLVLSVFEDDYQTEDSLECLLDDFVQTSNKLCQKISNTEKYAVAFAKAIVIAADVACSALTAEKKATTAWLQAAWQNYLHQDKLRRIIQDKIGTQQLRGFQQRVAQSTAPVTVTVAGCGTGKTVAAYAWACRHALKKKLFFCYPTTGTASAGFEDYLLAQNDLERALIHSRAAADLERLLPSDEDDELSASHKLEALRAWPQQVIACTVDTVLGLVQNQRRGLITFPIIAASAFVFDEIHNYDGKLFGALLRFLKALPQVPALLMSASLPPHRYQMLQDALSSRLGQIITGDPDLESWPRYTIHWLASAEACWPWVLQAIKNQQRVLWVCNTVNDAITIYDQACRQDLPIKPLLYHSRFRYRDRVAIQKKVIDQFRRKGPVLVISTQVCEMSLDISADVLISALPPFPALIQRLGRLNRYYNPAAGSAPCFLYDFSCRENQPYRQSDLNAARRAVQELLDKPLSQQNLAQRLADLQLAEEIGMYSAWLDGVWKTHRRPLREGSATINILLEQDLPEIKAYLKARRLKATASSLTTWIIPMLFTNQCRFVARFGGYPVVADQYVNYDPERGAQWRNQKWEIL